MSLMTFTPRVLPKLDLTCLVCVEIVIVEGWRYAWAVYYYSDSDSSRMRVRGQLVHKERSTTYEQRLSQGLEAYQSSLGKDY